MISTAFIHRMIAIIINLNSVNIANRIFSKCVVFTFVLNLSFLRTILRKRRKIINLKVSTTNCVSITDISLLWYKYIYFILR